MSELSIIVPCRNNAPVLTETLTALHRVVAHHSLSVETLIVDDEREDATVEVATRCAHELPALHVRILARKRLQHGLGGIPRYGMAFALGRYCVLVSPDGTDPVDLLPTVLFHLRAGSVTDGFTGPAKATDQSSLKPSTDASRRGSLMPTGPRHCRWPAMTQVLDEEPPHGAVDSWKDLPQFRPYRSLGRDYNHRGRTREPQIKVMEIVNV